MYINNLHLQSPIPEGASGVETGALLRPGGAEDRFRRATVGSLPPVQVAVKPILFEIGTGGDDLDQDGPLVLPLELAQVGGLSAAQQRLKSRLAG